MRRPLVIALAVMGGGALAAGTMPPNRNRDCEQARAAQLPNANEICARTGSSSSRHGGSSSGWRSSIWNGGTGHGSSSTTTAIAAGMAASRLGTPSSAVGVGASPGGSIGTASRGGFGGSGGSSSSGGG